MQNSARIAKSNMIGDANKESSQVLWIEIVLWPPKNSSDMYSSKALLESPIVTGKKIKRFGFNIINNNGGNSRVNEIEILRYDF